MMAEDKKTPTLIMLCGLPGSGKSTVAKMIGERLSARGISSIILRTDEIRRELFPARTYSAEESTAVYATMMDRAKINLQAGCTVLLDATFVAAAHRAVPLKLAEEAGVDSQTVHVVSPPDLTRTRLATRSGDLSEADYSIYLRLREQFEEIVETHIRIDNVGDLGALQAAIALKI